MIGGTDARIIVKPYWQTGLFWLIFATTLVMRAPINAVGPMAGDICDAYEMSWSVFGVLAGIPMATFGICSLLAPSLVKRFGAAVVFAGTLLGVAAGSGLRAVPETAVLFGGTVLMSMSIAGLNILMPTLVKTGLASHQRQVMGIYSALIGVSGVLGAASSGLVRAVFPPLSAPFLFWSAAALLCLVFFPVLKGFRLPESGAGASGGTGGSPVWLLIGMMAFQATLTTTFASYTTAYFADAGLPAEDGRVILNLFLGCMVFGSLIAGCLKEPSRAVLLYGPLGLVYLGAIAVWGTVTGGYAGAAAASALLGTLHGAVMAFAFIAVIRKTPSTAILKVSGIVQFGGYFLAGLGPWFAGMLVQHAGFAVLPRLLAVFVVCWVLFALLTSRYPDRDSR